MTSEACLTKVVVSVQHLVTHWAGVPNNNSSLSALHASPFEEASRVIHLYREIVKGRRIEEN